MKVCVENNGSRSDMSMNVQDSRSYLAPPKGLSWWQKRTRLEKRMAVGGAIITFTCAGFLVGLIAMSTCGKSSGHTANLASFGNHNTDENEIEVSRLCTTTDCLNAAISVQEAVDLSVDPCEDFFRYSCGRWIRNHPIPEDKNGYDVFTKIRDDLFLNLRTEIEKPVKEDDLRSIRNGKEAYAACMNVEMADTFGMKRLEAWVKSFGGWPMTMNNWDSSTFDWEEVIVRMASEMSFYVIGVYIYADEKNTSQNAIYVGGPSVSLDPDYLLNPENFSQIIDQYKLYMNDMATIMSQGRPINQRDMDNVLEFETRLANISDTALESEELQDLYNQVTVQQLAKITNHKFDWLRFLNGVFSGIKNVTEDDTVIVSDFSPLIHLFDYLETVDNRTMANYLLWRYVRKYSWHANNKTRDRSFAFTKQISGIDVQEPRWLSCVDFVNDLFPNVMGSLYVHGYVPNDTKSMAELMVAELRKTLSQVLESNTWMDEETLTKAKEKAESLVAFVAYPDWVHNATALDSYYVNFTSSPIHIDNLRNSLLESSNLSLYQILEPFDRETWVATPSEVNAYYSTSTNSITFPAGVLQPPFFGSKNLKAMNYGAVGSIIGHEITHAFDSNGRQNDMNGNLVNWWSNSSLEQYYSKANCIRKQYFRYCLDDIQKALNKTDRVCLNGNDTLGENIADNGGVKIALHAYKNWIKEHGEEARLPGQTHFSPMQLFFISFAQVWCGQATAIGRYNSVQYDSHSPDEFRILGTLSNLEDFAEAFQCKVNSTFNPSNKCSFW